MPRAPPPPVLPGTSQRGARPQGPPQPKPPGTEHFALSRSCERGSSNAASSLQGGKGRSGQEGAPSSRCAGATTRGEGRRPPPTSSEAPSPPSPLPPPISYQ